MMPRYRTPNRKRTHARRTADWKPIATAILLLAAMAVLALPVIDTGAASASGGRQNRGSHILQRDPVAAAWQRAQQAGAYHFTTTIVETTAPSPSVANVGQSSRQQHLYLEGDTNLPKRGLHMVLWQSGGSVMDTRDGIEVRIEGDEAYGRSIGETWQPIDDFSGAFAPGNDLMAYLAGARNVRHIERTDMPYALYRFDLNGPELADSMRDQFEAHLREEGELPPGVTLDVSDQFRDIIGGGRVWIDDDGLPKRLTVEVKYPQQKNGERVTTEIITDFSAYDRRALAEADQPIEKARRIVGLPASPERWRTLRQQAEFAAGTLCLLAIVITNRRSRAIYTAFVITMATAMVLTPLLQSAQVHAFNERAAAQQAVQAARREDHRQRAETQSAMLESNWHPNVSPEKQNGPQAVSEADNGASEPSRITETRTERYVQLAAASTPEPDSDDDGDGLTYTQELRLGTDPDEMDTDGDQITDDVEVGGFRFEGKTWYTDPLEADTNNDGLLDGVECPEQAREHENALSESTACQDTDGDLEPDVFDRDNDGDRVPDRMDLSPFSSADSQGSLYDADNPMLLQVDELEADRPVFVDFQLRPEDETHLWYALNVLDWPSGDEEGQIQRKAGNDSTFADVAEAGDAVAANASNGDMRLVPMLEIEIPYKEGHYGNLPVKEGAPEQRTSDLELEDWLDTSKLTPYGIAVRPMNDDGDLVAYVPLNLVADETGGDRTAFSARMFYWPTITDDEENTAEWGLTQQVRVVWLVQMLTDYRDEDGAWVLDVPQVVRAYPERWSLTGLAIREDHGLDVAITYEDPEGDEDLSLDDPLWGVARGLEASFVVGRDEDDDGERDITIAEIDTRFSLTSTSTITARFGISPEIELETHTYSYDHEDFITHIMMIETHQVLSDTFTSYVDQGADAVTMLFAQESRARTGNLDGDDDTVMIEDNRITLRLAQDSVPVEVATYLNWGPFQYDEDDDRWASYPIAEYLDKLEVRLKEVLDEYKDEENYEEILTGQVTVAKAYYITLFHGLRNLVEVGPDLTGPQEPSQTDEELANWLLDDPIQESGGLIARQITTLTRTFYRAGIGLSLFHKHKKAGDLLASIGGWVDEKKSNFANGWSNLGKLKKTLAVGVGAIAVAAVIGLLVTAIVYYEGGEALVYVINGLAVVMSTVDVVAIGFNLVKRGSQTVTQALKHLKVLKLSLKAGAIAFAIAVIVIWGVFIHQIKSEGVKAGSLAFNAALATTIAATITAGILLAITAIPIVGQIIAALIFLIDAITMFVCTASDSGHWFCDYGISGLITAGITWIIYSANVMIDVEDENRLDITEFEQEFVDPDKGLSVGGSIAFKATIENEIELIEWKDTNYDWKAGAYWWQYSDKTLRSTTFDYALQDNTRSIHSNLDRGDIRNDWEDAGDDRVRLVAKAETEVALNRAGINKDVNLYLIEGYALPVQECWAFPIILPFPFLVPVCYVRTERGSGDIDLGKSLYYDVFPETLDDFYDLATVDGGYALGWSQDTDPSFPRLRDADGDGLRVYRDDGADPDDNAWDTDGDGLSDYLEIEQGIDPRDVDSDDDGLNDRQEVILGTSPLRTDTDYDGLTDKEEEDGWEFVYDFRADGSQIRTWVTADPLSSDPDLDTLTDFQEKVFGFHPQVPSDPNVLTLDSEVREARAPQLLLRFSERANATAFRDDSGYANNGSCEGAACPVSGHEGRYGNAPHFDGTGDYVVADDTCGDIAGADAYTFGAWFYPEGGTSGDAIILAFNTASGGNILHLGFNTDSRTVYVTSPDHRIESGTIGLDRWHHAAVTIHADGTAHLYVNGSQVSNTLPTTVSPASGDRFSIGQEWDGNTPSNFFQGLIDEVLVFDHALDQAEIDEMRGGRHNPEDATVRPGDTLSYEATVKNELFNRYAQGLLSTRFPTAFSEVPPEAFILNPQEETVLTGDVTIAETAASGTYSLTQEVDALITDWREDSNYAELLYHFAEAGPPFEDSSGSQPPRDGDCSGAHCPTSTQGRYGDSLRFDGLDDYVTNDNVARYLTGDAFTFGAWVYPAALMNGSGTILAFNSEGGGNRNTLMWNADNGRFFYRDDETSRVYSDGSYQIDLWHHVIVVFEADEGATLYVNAENAATFTTPVRPADEGSLTVGQEWDGGTPSEFFMGRIDEVVVFDRALTAEEVRDYYGDPVLNLPLNDGPWSTVFDDTSPFDNDASCSRSACPEPHVSGIIGHSAEFNGSNYLTVPDHAVLALDDGDFTLSTWLYPEGEADALSDCAFRAEYFANTGKHNTEDTVRRCESWPVNHDWGKGKAIDRGSEFYNYFSVRWTGTFLFQEGEHTFTFDHDDGMVAWLDDDKLLDDWGNGVDDQEVTRHVSAGLHTVRIEYHEDSGSARAKVSWDPPPLPHPQGILGAQGDPEGQDYPAIQRVGDRVRVILNEQTAYLSPAGTLSQNTWHHVATTFDGATLVLYVDGIEIGQLAASGQRPFGGTGLDVGRSARSGELTLEKVSVLETGDSGQGGSHQDELVLELQRDGRDWETVWTQSDVWAEEEYNLSVTRTFEDEATLRMTESDDGEYTNCWLYGCDGEDPEDEAMGSHSFDILDVSAYESVTNFEGDESTYRRDRADLLWHASTDAIPFEGKLDEIRIYKQAFTPGEVKNLYNAGTELLRLSLDDPPGSTEFADDLDEMTGTCDENQCPTAGLPGRDNWAVSFDGENDVVTFDDANIETLKELTIASWVKLDTMPAGQVMRFVTLKDEKAVLRYDGGYGEGQLHFYIKVDGTLRHLRVDDALQADTWIHVAGTYDGSAMRLYKDGVEIASQPVSGNLGSGSVIDLSSAGEPLDGMLDDVVIMRRALDAGEVEALAYEAPQLILTLDEPLAITEFADESGNGNTGTCTGMRCPSAGAKGQLGRAADFDGVDDYVELAHSDSLMPGDAMTLIAWVKAVDPNVDQKLAGKSSIGDGYVLGLKDGQLYPEIWDNGGDRYWAQWGRVNPDTWTFLGLTWEAGGEMVGYINGEVAGRTDVGSRPIGANTGDFIVGAAPWNVDRFPVNGRVDHVLLYHRTFAEDEMRDLFRLQAKWVEERQNTDITVDADIPASTLISDDVYRPNADAILLASTADESTHVTMMEVEVNHRGGTTGWQAAPRCESDATTLQGDEAWCPTFEPTVGEGQYDLQLRATDGVGHREAPATSYTFLVDNTPPEAQTAHQDGERIQASPRPDSTWIVPLTGTVVDPQIEGTASPGSGVSDIKIRLTATAHPTDTQAPRTAALTGDTWTVDYPLPYADATGTYTLAVQSTDNVGNVSAFIERITIGLDTAPPVASLDNSNTMTVPITNTLTLTGRVTETGVISTGIVNLPVGFVPMAKVAMSQTVAIFHFDEPPTATSFKSKGNGRATCNTAPCPEANVPGIWGTALDFNNGAYLTADFVSAAITNTGGLSFGGWVRPEHNGSTNPTYAVLAFNSVGGGDRNRIIRRGGQWCYADAEIGDRCGGPPANYETWYHVMVVITEDGAGTLYIDGHAEVTFQTTVRPDPNGRFSLGQEWDGATASEFLEGKLDEVTIYDRTLTPEEIVSYYRNTLLDRTGDGVTETGWHLEVPTGLDGLYQINLRPEDRFANSPDGDWEVWNGEIDTTAPRVEVAAEEKISYLDVRTTYTCRAADFNLVYRSEDHPDYDFRCPCQSLAPLATVYTPTYYHEISPWYAGTFTDTNRLYELEASCTIVGPDVHDTTTRACDAYGHCASAVAPEASEIVHSPFIDSAVLTPTLDTVIDTLDPVHLEGQAYAQDHLKTLTVFANSTPIDSFTWASVGVTKTDWITTWTPVSEGTYLLTTEATDQNDQHQPFIQKTKVIVDVAPPTVAIDPLILTTTHRLSQNRVALTGQTDDTNGVSEVQIRTNDGQTQTGWQTASLYGTTWQLDWNLGEEPAGKPYTVAAKAIDAAGHTTHVTQTVTVDLETPNPITLTLTSGGEVVTPGLTLRSAPSDLTLSWVAGSQPTDLSRYEVLWTTYSATGVATQRSLVPALGPLTSAHLAQEAQRIRPRVISHMASGNRQSDIYGTVTVDSPLTPDYISLETAPGEWRPYLGWMESGCTRLSVDRRVARNAPESAAIDDPQQLYATWDSQALRLAWTGANWNYAGDLFIYLDTTVGGAAQAVNVHGGRGIPVSFALDSSLDYGADAVVWVEDAHTAHLLTWNAGAQDWDSQPLPPAHFRFEPGRDGGHTDLYLPFALLGISDPTTNPLTLIAFATEEDAMNLWAAMPPGNPLNSDRVVPTDVFAPENAILGLTQAYVFPSLGPGLCPNAPFGDADVELGLSVEPAGTTYSFLNDNIFWLGDNLFEDNKAVDLSQALTFLDVDHPPLGDGDRITYTLHYANRGTEAATGIQLYASGMGALRFGGATTTTIPVGDIAPGATGIVSFTGEIDVDAAQTAAYEPCGSSITCTQFLKWAMLEAAVVDSTLGLAMPLDVLLSHHEVDVDAPEFFGIQQPEQYVNPGDNVLSGYSFDPSGIPSLDLILQSTGDTTQCADPTPSDGQWDCVWNATHANGGVPPSDGETLILALLPIDGQGLEPLGAAPLSPNAVRNANAGEHTLIVDAVSPEGSYDAATTAAYSSTTVSGESVTFSGVVTDNHAIGSVDVCLNGECGEASVQAAGQAPAVINDAVTAAAAIPDCDVTDLQRTFFITDSFTVGSVQLGINADHERRNDLWATLTSPSGTVVQVLGPREGTPLEAQNLDVQLFDAAGAGQHEDKTSDDTAAPYFDREARPYEPMAAYRGEQVAGTWTLSLCDSDPLTKNGVYHRAELYLMPTDTAATAGTWSYTASSLGAVDGEAQTVETFAVDRAGNRSPLSFGTLDFVLDNVAPTLTATQLETMVEIPRDRKPIRILEGSATDDGRLVRITALVKAPSGRFRNRQVSQSGMNWWFDLTVDDPGTYKIWVEAFDAAENTTTIGVYEVTATIERHHIVMPLIMKLSLGVRTTTIHLPVVLRQKPKTRWAR